MSIIPYAGKDITELGLSTSKRAKTAYCRFRRGFDTMKIARRYHVQEPVVVRWITEERCRRLGLSIPFTG